MATYDVVMLEKIHAALLRIEEQITELNAKTHKPQFVDLSKILNEQRVADVNHTYISDKRELWNFTPEELERDRLQKLRDAKLTVQDEPTTFVDGPALDN